MKLLLNMIPIWLVTIPFGISVAQTSTFFIKQATTLNREITPSFLIPPASVYSLAAIGMVISVTLYDKILVPILRNLTGNERGIKILQRVGIGMAFSIVTMVVAALVEKKEVNPSGERSGQGFRLNECVLVSSSVPHYRIRRWIYYSGIAGVLL